MAYVLAQSGGTWSQQAELIASDSASNDYFGDSVAISGNTVMLATPARNPSATYVFVQPVVTFSGSPQQPLTTDGNGNFVAQVTITNTGNVTVTSLQITSSTLGSGSLLSAPPAITNLAPGAGAVVTLTFPPNSAPSGATTAPLKLNGTYSVTSPALSGNWALTFRSVTL